MGELLPYRHIRHTFASWLVEDGTDIYKVQKLLGHGSLDRASLKCDSFPVRYEIETTNIFDELLAGVSAIRTKAKIITRFDHIKLGNFGDHKGLGEGLFELRFFFGPGFRAYYTVKGGMVVFLLCGGDKSTQERDIKKARKIMIALE